MVQELLLTSYLGVCCSRCKERIPVAKRAAALYEDLRRDDTDDTLDINPRAFALRCKACEEESTYKVQEIQEFEGPPRVRAEKGKSARA
jgi:hypothetical protein